jgi:hypothetical protein
VCSLLRISRLYTSNLLLSLHVADSNTAPSLIAVLAGAFLPSALPLEHPQYLRRLPRLPRSPRFQGLLSDLHIFILSLLSLQVSFPNPQLSSRTAPTIPNMLIPQIAVLKARISDLIIKSTFLSSSSETSASTYICNNVRKDPAIPPKYPIKKPSMRLFPDTQAPLPTVNVITRHSHTFNSSTATGLDKLGQLQFAEVVKGWIVGMCPVNEEKRLKPTGR